MPSKSEQIPVLSGVAMDQFHYGTSLWQVFVTGHTHSFHINRIEDAKEHLKFPLPPHRKTVFDFIFLANGTSIRTKGLDSYGFEGGTFFFLPAYQISSHEFYSPNASGYYCHFDAGILTQHLVQSDFLNQFSFLQFIGNPLVKVVESATVMIDSILHRLEQENDADKPNYKLVSAYLAALFLELQPFVTTIEKVKENAALRITQQYKNALVQYVYEKRAVSDYANLLAVTPDHLNKCVKRATGKTAQDLLCDMVLMEAKALLQQTSLSISEIAFKIGKEDPSDFARFFKSKAGLTPSQYRSMP